MMRRPWWQWAIVIALLIIVAFFAFVPQWKKETIDTGFSDAALRNPMLVAQRLAERYKGQMLVSRDIKLDIDTLDMYDTLVLQNTHGMLNDRQVDDLLIWLRQGGRLIYGGYTPDRNAREVSDPLLQALSIRTNPASSGLSGRALDGWISDQCGNTQRTLFVNAQERKIEFYSQTSFVANKGKQPSYALQRKVGKGELFAFSDLLVLSNFNIECADHAQLARDLFEQRNTLWIWAAPSSNWLKTLIRALPVSVTLVLAALFVWLWYRASRVGPARDLLQQERPSISEHHNAIADKLWRQKDDQQAFHTLIEPLLKYAERTLTQKEYQSLAKLASPTSEQELLALYDRLKQLGVLR